MHSNGYPPASSMTNEELIRVTQQMTDNNCLPPLSITQELLRRYTRKVDAEPDVTDVDPKQTSFDFE
jgi:hypothetical protein